MRSELKKRDDINQNLFSNKLMKLFSKIKSFLVKKMFTSNLFPNTTIFRKKQRKESLSLSHLMKYKSI